MTPRPFPTQTPFPALPPRPLRRVLIVSPSFPPLNTPDLQRIRMSLPYYRAHGWEPIILTVEPSQQSAPVEEYLLETVPTDIRVVRCGALPLGLSRRIGLGNIGLRSWFHLFWAGSRILRREPVDLVFFSSTQFITFLLGRIWRMLHGVRYVIDLQDPWRTDYYERPGVRKPPGGWKYQFARAQALLFEGWTLRRTSGLMSVSSDYIRDLNERYRWFDQIPTDVIRFGASEGDLAVAQKTHSGLVPEPPPGTLRFIYTGAAGPITPHAVTVLFRALLRFRELRPKHARYFRLEFIGTDYGPAERAQATIKPIADALGVGDQVIEIAQRVGHLDSLRIQCEADALLMLGSSDLAYSPSKLYPYYITGRPMLGVVFKNSQLETILRELNCAVLASFEDGVSTLTAEEAICDFFSAAVRQFPAHSLPVRNEEAFRERYSAESLTARQTALFDLAVKPLERKLSGHA